MNLEEMLQAYFEKLSERAPALREILDQAKAGVLDDQEALMAMIEVISKDPTLKFDLETITHEFLKPIDPPKANPSKPEITFQGERGLPGLNPLYEAALIERAQFDEDMPELRFGPLRSGVAPAVAVDTKARHPAAIGVMMREASEKIRSAVDVHEDKRRKQIEAVASGSDVDLMAKHGEIVARSNMDVAMETYGSSSTDLPEYKRGQIPAPVKIATPSGSALMAMPPEERRAHAWKFLSTTQGRRTATGVIREQVAKALRDKGYEVREREHESKVTEAPLAHYEWTISLSGPGSTQDSFSVIDVAARALAHGLQQKIAGLSTKNLTLEVISINLVDLRSVGWAARVLE
jgi:hypothetical protein